MVTADTQADWCQIGEDFAICGTDMKEHSRRSEGVKWCFHHRGRAEFARIVSVPDGLSYYGPSVAIKCTHCSALDGDLFPGWSREGGDY